jgi:ribosomal protein S18 acetylase RimI-like enzyme
MPVSEVTIRRADKDDYEAICAVTAEAAEMHATALPHIFAQPSVSAFPREYLLDLMSTPDHVVFVASKGDTVVGFVELALKKAEGPGRTARTYVSMNDIAVLTAHRGQGIGTKLATQGLEWAKENGASSIELNVWDFNEAAVRLYERLGACREKGKDRRRLRKRRRRRFGLRQSCVV